MASNRWIALDPDVLNHPLVGAGQRVEPADKSRGSYSRMEAWVWLICNASFADHTVINRGRKMTLQRGDLLGAWRYLAFTWNWSAKTVRVWVEKLVADNMLCKKAVELQIEHNGGTENQGREEGNYYGNQAQVLSVVNYWRYQFEGYELGQPTRHDEGQANGNQRATKGQHITKGQGNKGKEDTTPAGHGDGADEAFDLYNQMAKRCRLPVPRALTSDRRKSLLARLREHGGLDAWREALAKVEQSAFLRGKGTRAGWRVDLDFLLQPSSFLKVIEGKYGNGVDSLSLEDCRRLNALFPIKHPSDWQRYRERYGPPPGEPGCLIPQEFISELGPSVTGVGT
jgi:hypothetical protein